MSTGQIVTISGELDQELQDTLIGPPPAVSIIAHRIVLREAPLNPTGGYDDVNFYWGKSYTGVGLPRRGDLVVKPPKPAIHLRRG